MKELNMQDESNSSKAYHFKDIQELITLTNGQLEDVLYIGERANGPKYRSQFTFMTKNEAVVSESLQKTRHSRKQRVNQIFVHNEKTGETVPFNKDDLLMYDRGYGWYSGADRL